jgi:hypothetical protein
MLVMLTDQQVIPPEKICAGCLWASSQGAPRWQQNNLCCGRQIRQRTACEQPAAYQCQMGFQLVDILD